MISGDISDFQIDTSIRRNPGTTIRWFSPDPSFSSINKTDRHDITEILLKVVLNTINQAKTQKCISSGMLSK
jgi:hypothetical protein